MRAYLLLEHPTEGYEDYIVVGQTEPGAVEVDMPIDILEEYIAAVKAWITIQSKLRDLVDDPDQERQALCGGD